MTSGAAKCVVACTPCTFQAFIANRAKLTGAILASSPARNPPSRRSPRSSRPWLRHSRAATRAMTSVRSAGAPPRHARDALWRGRNQPAVRRQRFRKQYSNRSSPSGNLHHRGRNSARGADCGCRREILRRPSGSRCRDMQAGPALRCTVELVGDRRTSHLLRNLIEHGLVKSENATARRGPSRSSRNSEGTNRKSKRAGQRQAGISFHWEGPGASLFA